MARDWNLLLSAAMLTACLFCLGTSPANGWTTFSNDTCSNSTNCTDKFTLRCPASQWIHVVSKLHSSNCSSPLNAGTKLTSSSANFLKLTCSIGAVSSCDEHFNLGTDFCSKFLPNCTEHFVNVTYECIEGTDIHNMCADKALVFNASFDTVYLVSPSLLNETRNETKTCRYVVRGSDIAVQVLYASAYTPLKFQGDCNATFSNIPFEYINHESCDTTVSYLDISFNTTGGDNKKAWIRMKGRNMSLQCNGDINDAQTPALATVSSTAGPTTTDPRSPADTTGESAVSSWGHDSGNSTKAASPASNTTPIPAALKHYSGLQETHKYIIIGVCTAVFALMCIIIVVLIRRRIVKRSNAADTPLQVIPLAEERNQRNLRPDATASDNYANIDLDDHGGDGSRDNNTIIDLDDHKKLRTFHPPSRVGNNDISLRVGAKNKVQHQHHNEEDTSPILPQYINMSSSLVSEEKGGAAMHSDPYYSEIKDTDYSLPTEAAERPAEVQHEEVKTSRPVSEGIYEAMDLDSHEEHRKQKPKPQLKFLPLQKHLSPDHKPYENFHAIVETAMGLDSHQEEHRKQKLKPQLKFLPLRKQLSPDHKPYENVHAAVKTSAKKGRHNNGFADGDKDDEVDKVANVSSAELLEDSSSRHETDRKGKMNYQRDLTTKNGGKGDNERIYENDDDDK